MRFTDFLGNLPTWVTADDIQSWLNAEALVADSIKVIRNPETQESKGFAFIEAPNQEEMQAIIRRFDRAPLEDKLLRANPAQPPKGKGAPGGSRDERRPGAGGPRRDGVSRGEGRPQGDRAQGDRAQGDRMQGDRTQGDRTQGDRTQGDRPAGDRQQGDRPQGERTANRSAGANPNAGKRRGKPSGTSAFAEELAKAL
ncbi:MAG: hypothetical protein ACK532_05690 [Acidobacteriota bacterium]